jgi:SAM-dependent methyltransferase
MNKSFQQIINQLSAEGKDYSDFKALLAAIKASGVDVSKDEILEFVANDYRIQLHTTPNSIAKLIAHLAKNSHCKSAIDICCGTGNILYYLQNEIDDLTGVEIAENVAELTKYFIPDLHIITADSILYPFQRKYDLIVGNIPFGMRIELNGKRIPGEEAFLRKAQDLLNENGKAIMLVPYSVLISGPFQNFRNDFVNYLQEVVALPSGSIRNTQIKTALLVFSKQASNEIKLTQLQQFENLHQEYVSAEHTIYSTEQLNERWDPEYHLTREKSLYKELDNFQTKELQDLAEIIKGKMIPADTLKSKGDYLYLKPLHIKENRLNLESGLKYVSNEDLSERDYRYIIQPGDIVISTIFNDLKMYVYQAGDEAAFASNNMAIIRSAKQDYILSYLQTEEGKRIFKIQAEDLRTGDTIPHLSIKNLASIKIPILPFADLNALGDVGISRSTEAQLRDALEQLSEYKNQVQALEKERENLAALKTFIYNRFDRVESQLEVVNKKLDDLLSLLKELKTDFEQIQNLPREDEEKLFKLCQKIDTKLDVVYNKEHQTIEGYIEEIKRWLDLWELLDLQSQKFLPIAEFIFDELSKLEDADYAPFVVQYCRTLENEILKKLFENYHSTGLDGVDREELIKDDIKNSNTGKNSNTSKFAQMVKHNKMTYTLGDMNFIMALLKKEGRTLPESPLLQHFRTFTISYFDEKIVEAEFLKDVNKLTNEFRNKAAHPYSISIELAKECQGLLRKSLNIFLESVRRSNV